MKYWFVRFIVILCISNLIEAVYLFNDNPNQMVSIASVGGITATNNTNSTGFATAQPICKVIGVFLPVATIPGHWTQVRNTFILEIPLEDSNQTPGYAQTAKVYSTASTTRYMIYCKETPPRPLKISEIIGNINKATNKRCSLIALPTGDADANTANCGQS